MTPIDQGERPLVVDEPHVIVWHYIGIAIVLIAAVGLVALGNP